MGTYITKMKLIFYAVFVSVAIQSANANLLIPELKDAQAAFLKSNNLCDGVFEHVKPHFDPILHPQALIAIGDIYQSCSKDDPTKKFKRLVEVYGDAAMLDSISEPEFIRSYIKETSARAWGYHRLWKTLNYSKNIDGYNRNDFTKDIHILAIAAAYSEGDNFCWGELKLWLQARDGCEAIAFIASSFVYPISKDGLKSPLSQQPLRGLNLQESLFRTSTYRNENKIAKEFYEYLDQVNKRKQKLSGYFMCNKNIDSDLRRTAIFINSSLAAIRNKLPQSPYYNLCRFERWSATTDNVKLVSAIDGGVTVKFSDGRWGVAILLGHSSDLLLEAGKELGIDVKDIKKMDVFVKNLQTRISNQLK